MNVEQQIAGYIKSLGEPKSVEMNELHQFVLDLMPGCQKWFLDGKNSEGKVISNPNIGYGKFTIQYAKGTSKEFYQVGVSANTGGISVYIMGLDDKNFLAQTFESRIGKASVTGYCIKFKSLRDIHLPILAEAIRCGISVTGQKK